VAEQITIGRPQIQTLVTEYEGLRNDANIHTGPFKSDVDPVLTIDLSAPPVVLTGPSWYPSGQLLKKQTKVVYTEVHTRAKAVTKQATDLQYGLQFILDDSERTESLNDMSAEQFEAHVPNSAAGTTGTTGTTGTP